MVVAGPRARIAPAHLGRADLRRLELGVVMTASAWMIGRRRMGSGWEPSTPLAGPGCRQPCDVGADSGLPGASPMQEDAAEEVEDAAVADRVVTDDGNLEKDCRCRWIQIVEVGSLKGMR